MRKYKQLILIIVSIVSVTLLLIYRHEYNRLRYVLEVFNFFGQPSQCNALPELLLNSTTGKQHDWGPIPVWQTMEEDTFIYSAFLKTGNEVETLVVHHDDQVSIKSCYLWFDNKSKTVIGKLKFTKIKIINNNPKLALYKYYCRVNSAMYMPYAVSFSNKNKRTKELSKIMVQPLVDKRIDSTTICVVPSESYSKQNVIEFLSYYTIIGVDSFIVYNNNVPHKLIVSLEKLSTKLGINLVSFPWNFPYPMTSNTRKIIEQDCLLRTNHKSRNILVLDWTEFIVPKYHLTLPEILDHYDPKNQTQQFNLQTLVFCTDDHNKIDPNVLHSVYYDDAKPIETTCIYRNNKLETNDVINAQEISNTIATVHRYIDCATHSSHSKKDDTMLRFSLDLRNSILYKSFKFNQL